MKKGFEHPLPPGNPPAPPQPSPGVAYVAPPSSPAPVLQVVYCHAILHKWVDLSKWYRLEETGLNTWTYRPFWFKRYQIEYIGGLDPADRPHGLGHWSDSNFHGEHYFGYFSDGAPEGPAQSGEEACPRPWALPTSMSAGSSALGLRMTCPPPPPHR